MMFFKRHFTGKRETLYLRGLALSALGVVILSPDGLLLRMASEAGAWEIVFYRSLFMGLGMGAILALKCKGANNREQAVCSSWASPLSTICCFCLRGLESHTARAIFGGFEGLGECRWAWD